MKTVGLSESVKVELLVPSTQWLNSKLFEVNNMVQVQNGVAPTAIFAVNMHCVLYETC